MNYLRVSFEQVENHPHLKELIQEGVEVRVDAAMFDFCCIPEDHQNISTILLILGEAHWIPKENLPKTSMITIRELFE